MGDHKNSGIVRVIILLIIFFTTACIWCNSSIAQYLDGAAVTDVRESGKGAVYDKDVIVDESTPSVDVVSTTPVFTPSGTSQFFGSDIEYIKSMDPMEGFVVSAVGTQSQLGVVHNGTYTTKNASDPVRPVEFDGGLIDADGNGSKETRLWVAEAVLDNNGNVTRSGIDVYDKNFTLLGAIPQLEIGGVDFIGNSDFSGFERWHAVEEMLDLTVPEILLSADNTAAGMQLIARAVLSTDLIASSLTAIATFPDLDSADYLAVIDDLRIAHGGSGESDFDIMTLAGTNVLNVPLPNFDWDGNGMEESNEKSVLKGLGFVDDTPKLVYVEVAQSPDQAVGGNVKTALLVFKYNYSDDSVTLVGKDSQTTVRSSASLFKFDARVVPEIPSPLLGIFGFMMSGLLLWLRGKFANNK